MCTQEDSAAFNSENERGADSETDSTLDSNSQALQHGGNSVPKSALLTGKQDYKGPTSTREGITRPMVSGTGELRATMVSALQVIKITLVLFLVIFVPRPKVPTRYLCTISILSGYSSHAHKHDPPRKHVAPPDFITLAWLQSRLGQVMKDSASSSTAVVHIKNSEMALRDLRTRVKHSALSKKDILGRNLGSFVNDAKVTGANLQRFGSRVWGAVDQIICFNEHTLAMLESVSTGEEDKEKSHSWWRRGEGGEEAVWVPDPQELANVWEKGIGLLDITLRKLIHEAQDNIGSLQRLEENLNNIVDTVIEEEHVIRDKETKLKWKRIRKIFGMNAEESYSHYMSRALLETVKNDRRNALDHVTGVLFKLTQMSNDLDNLREGVAAPLILGSSSGIPIEAHIRSMRGATERLVNGQTNMGHIGDNYRREKFSD